MSLKVDKVNMPLSTHLKRHADGELRLREIGRAHV